MKRGNVREERGLHLFSEDYDAKLSRKDNDVKNRLNLREEIAATIRQVDLDCYGFGLDRFYFWIMVFAHVTIVALMIAYSVNRGKEVQKSQKNQILAQELAFLPRDPSDPTKYLVPLPHLYLFHVMSPHTVFLPYPESDTRITFHTSGFNHTDYASGKINFPAASAGTFYQTPGVDSGPFYSAFDTQLEFDLGSTEVSVHPGGIFHCAFSVIKQDHPISGHIPATPVLVKLGHAGSSPPAGDFTWTKGDGGADNSTYIYPTGAFLIRYSAVHVYKTNGDVWDEGNLISKRMQIEDVVYLQDSPVKSIPDYEAIDPGVGPYIASEIQPDPLKYDYLISPNSTVELLHLYLQYTGSMKVTKEVRQSVYTLTQAYSDVSGVWSFLIAVVGNVVTIVFVMWSKRKERDERQRILMAVAESRVATSSDDTERSTPPSKF